MSKFLRQAQDAHNRFVDSTINSAVEFMGSVTDMPLQFRMIYKGDLCDHGHNAPARLLIDFMRPESLRVFSLKANFDKALDRMIDTGRAVEQQRDGDYLIVAIKPAEPKVECP